MCEVKVHAHTDNALESTNFVTLSKGNGSFHPEKIVLTSNGQKCQSAIPGDENRESWGKKIDFLLSVVGFAVDLGNVWRFPYICYKNGGGAFLVPYAVMLVFGGLPLFYMELALGQYQKAGCITVWERICPMFKGIGYGICAISTFVAIYYNTIVAWSMYFLFASFRSQVPWATCGNPWNSPRCTSALATWGNSSINVTSVPISNGSRTVSSAQEYFERVVLEQQYSDGIGSLGGIKWSMALCLLLVFIIVYFSLWKGIKSSGKVVWVTATLPYVVLLTLLVRGVTLDGSLDGIIYYLKPQWHMLKEPGVWIDAAAQVFFSLGPGFGVLMALSSYNKFNNNCYRDAMVTAAINCLTSFLAGFVVFSVLGYMAHRQHTTVKQVAENGGAGLVFVVYPEAISTLSGSTFWSIIFFLMLITLGLDSTFGGLEALITGVCDEWPWIRKKRELFVAGLVSVLFLGSLPTVTYGGTYVVGLLDAHGAPISILFICFLEAIAVNWFYGVNRFARDIKSMLGYRPGVFWIVCWSFISPLFLLTLFIISCVLYMPITLGAYVYPPWAIAIGWIVTCTSLICIPIYLVYRAIKTRCSVEGFVKPSAVPDHCIHDIIATVTPL